MLRSRDVAKAEDLSRHVITELWGVGGPLYRLARATATPQAKVLRGEVVPVTATEHFVRGKEAAVRKIAEKLITALLPCFPDHSALRTNEEGLRQRRERLRSTFDARKSRLPPRSLLSSTHLRRRSLLTGRATTAIASRTRSSIHVLPRC